MRVSTFFLLCVVLLSFCAVQSFAQPPPARNVSVVIFYQDDSCTGDQWIGTGLIEEPSSDRCEKGEPGDRSVDASFVFTCTTMEDATIFRLTFFNGTRDCSGNQTFDYQSTGSPHECVPLSLAFEGQKFTIGAHIECDVLAQQSAEASNYAFHTLHSAALAAMPSPTPVQTLPSPTPVKTMKKSTPFSKIFQ